jgi:hypothetical protein
MHVSFVDRRVKQDGEGQATPHTRVMFKSTHSDEQGRVLMQGAVKEEDDRCRGKACSVDSSRQILAQDGALQKPTGSSSLQTTSKVEDTCSLAHTSDMFTSKGVGVVEACTTASASCTRAVEESQQELEESACSVSSEDKFDEQDNEDACLDGWDDGDPLCLVLFQDEDGEYD